MPEKEIYIYDGFSKEKSYLMGKLYVNVIRGKETYSFEYNDAWLKESGFAVFMDPELKNVSGRQYHSGKNIFGAFADSAPDRWGRLLMDRRERILADKEGRKPRKLHDSDYLLGVYDESRMGGLRYKLSCDGEFVSSDFEFSVPPLEKLRDLEEASRGYETEGGKLSEKWIKQLIKPGSSLGGARPKASVIDQNGDLWIAKFPSKNDENDTGAWEMVMHELAVRCKLRCPDAKIEKFSNFGSTFLVKRFDRNGKKRIHFASAMTLLGKNDGDSAAEGVSYLDLADFIKAYGMNPKMDLVELWKRIVFNMAVTNTDDHLRNHAFILHSRGWALSPLFDVNPVPYGDELSLNVDENDNRINKSLVLETAFRFGLDYKQASEILDNMVFEIKKNWEQMAKKFGLSQEQIEQMRPAFDFCYS